MSTRFYETIIIVLLFFVWIDGRIAHYHLRIEQNWSVSQQEMINNDMVMISRLNKELYEQSIYIKRLRSYCEWLLEKE